MKKTSRFLAVWVWTVWLLWGCSIEEKPSNINIEQIHNKDAQHILAPGLGTIGLIGNGIVHIYYHDQNGEWLEDKASRFEIPENNQGILAMGMGTFAVVEDNYLNFYRINALNNWQKEEYLRFKLPQAYDRLLAMKMPWETGVIAIESEGMVDFYYYYDQEWQHDPTAIFRIPRGISSYYMAGDMTLAVVDRQKLGLYFLGPEDGWEFMDHDAFVLLLPDGYDGIIPFEQQKIAVLHNNRLLFYSIDLEGDRWVLHDDLHFDLPIR